MVTIQVKLDVLKKEYPGFYEFFKNSLKNSDSKFKNYKENKIKCYYYIGFYLKPSQKTEEYYEELYSMKFDERVEEELKKVRVTITVLAGKFAVSDQVYDISTSVRPIVEEITKKKIYMEQRMSEEPDEEILNSIPDLEELEKRIIEEQEKQKDMLQTLTGLGIEDLVGAKQTSKELSPEQRLSKLISEEKYEEAEELLNEHPELKKRE